MAMISAAVKRKLTTAYRKRNRPRQQIRTRAAATGDKPREWRYPNAMPSTPRPRIRPTNLLLLFIFFMNFVGERLVVPDYAGRAAEGLPAARFSGKIPQGFAEDDFSRNRIAAPTLSAGKRPGATFAPGSGTTSRSRKSSSLKQRLQNRTASDSEFPFLSTRLHNVCNYKQ